VKSGPGKPSGSATKPAQAGPGGADGQEAEQQVSARPATPMASLKRSLKGGSCAQPRLQPPASSRFVLAARRSATAPETS
jgi:hypothetical protein